MTYRPTIRYPNEYKEHINQLFHCTHLDRNQIMRLAFHVAAHSKEFKNLLSNHLKQNSSFPIPNFLLSNQDLWLSTQESTVVAASEEGGPINGGRYVNETYRQNVENDATGRVNERGTNAQNTRSEKTRLDGEIRSRPSRGYDVQRTTGGGISVRFG